MAKDDKKIEQEDDNLEQYGVWVKTGSKGIEEIEPEMIDIDDEQMPEQLYITEEEEDLLDELSTTEEDEEIDIPLDGMDGDDRGDENLDFDSADEDPLDIDTDSFDLNDDSFDLDTDSLDGDENLDFSDVASIEETIEDSLPDFDNIDDIDMDASHPLENTVDRLEEQTELLAASSRELNILEKIESELSTIRSEIKDLKDEISTMRMIPRTGDVPEEKDGEKAPGFFDDSDLDETIALTGDELDNILDESVPVEEEAASPAGEEEDELLLEPEETLPEDEFQDETDFLTDTPLEDTLSEPDEDPALSMLTNMDDDDLLLDEGDENSLEITIDDQGEISEEEINLDNVLDEEEIGMEHISLDDADGGEEPLEMSNADDTGSEEIMSIDVVEPSDEVEELDIDDMIVESPDDDLEIEEVDLDDLGIDLSEFSDESIEEMNEEETADEVISDPAEALDESIFDEGEEVSFEEMDGDIVFEDEGSLSESDEIESVDLSEFSDDTLIEEIDDLESIELDDISLDEEGAEGLENSVEPLSGLDEEDGAVEFEDAPLDDFLEEIEEEPEEEPLEFPEEDEAEFPLPPKGSDDDTLIDEEISLDDMEEVSLDEDDISLDDIVGLGTDDEEDEISLDDIVGSSPVDDEEEISFEEIEEISLDEDDISFEAIADSSDDDEEITLEEEDEISLDDGEEISFGEEDEEEFDLDSIEEFSLDDDDETLIDEVEPDAPGEEPEETIFGSDEDGEEEFLDLDLDLDLDEQEENEPAEEDIPSEVAEEPVESFSIEIEEDSLDEAAPEDILQDKDEESLDELLEEIDEPEEIGEPLSLPTAQEFSEMEESGELNSLPYDLKEEIKEVLTYMDQLLEALPEDKIQEFARSEHFEVYKKIFTELGIAK